MTSSNDPQKPTGYRGALPERTDTLAKPWILGVIGIFVLVLVLSALEVPSRFIPDPTPLPTPSVAPSESPSADPSADPSAGDSADPSAEASSDASAAPSESAAASASP
jgi:cytoskeletal protein RodZ